MSVRASTDLAHELLGRHVGRRAQHRAGLGHRAALDPGDAEIGDLQPALAGQHDVGRLDVAMHHAALVAELQPGEQLLHDPHDVGEREAAPACRAAAFSDGAVDDIP